MAKQVHTRDIDILNGQEVHKNINVKDVKRLELKKKQVLRAKLAYQKYCREFIDLWLEVKGSKSRRLKKKNKLAK